MEVFVIILIAGLAAWQLVDVVHHSEIAAPVRNWARRAVASGFGPPAFAGRMISCPYCFAHWAALLCLVFLHSELAIVAWTLAATRLATAGNDLFKTIDLTPKHNDFDDDAEPDPATA